VLYRRAEVRIAFDAETGQQAYPHPGLLAEPMRAGLTDGFDVTRHQSFPHFPDRTDAPRSGQGPIPHPGGDNARFDRYDAMGQRFETDSIEACTGQGSAPATKRP
jgi:hypothetical protein